MRLDPAGLEYLVAVADEGGFQGAARRLGVSQSAVSQRIKALEADVGELLVVRTRPTSLTETGRTVLRFGRRIAGLHADLSATLGQERQRARIPIAVNADSLATWALAALDPIVQRGVDVEMVLDDESRTVERLRRGEVLGCVSTRAEPVLGATVRALGAMRYRAVASPGFAGRHLPRGLRARDLATTPFLVFGPHDPLQHRWVEEALGVPRAQLRERHVPSAEAYFRACLWGWGVAVIPLLQGQAAIDRGELVAVHDCFIDVSLFWHAWPSSREVAVPSGEEAGVDLLGDIGDALAATAAATLVNGGAGPRKDSRPPKPEPTRGG